MGSDGHGSQTAEALWAMARGASYGRWRCGPVGAGMRSDGEGHVGDGEEHIGVEGVEGRGGAEAGV